MARMSTAEAVVESLIRHGITTLFGGPGARNDPFFGAVQRAGERIRMVHVRHDQAAGIHGAGHRCLEGITNFLPSPMR